MPEVIPIIAAIIGAAGVGTSIYSLTNQPSTSPPKPAAPTPAQALDTATKTRATQEAALSQQFPSIQAATGGSLSPEAWLQLSQLLSGQAGAPGIGASVQDLLDKMTKGSGSTVTAGNLITSGGSTGPGLTPAGAFG
jgi:hypothetical protein